MLVAMGGNLLVAMEGDGGLASVGGETMEEWCGWHHVASNDWRLREEVKRSHGRTAHWLRR